MEIIAKYDMLAICAPAKGQTTPPQATFTCGVQSYAVTGFYENENKGTVRFMPMTEGTWRYSFVWGKETQTGEFTCVEATSHGPVRAKGYHFRYEDGKRYIPIGTTCYAWVHQLPEIVEQTIKTLENAPFNKIRMCVFPKSMPYNQNDPSMYPFEKKADGSWDVTKPDTAYWAHLESCIEALRDMEIEADLILFHPYDRWGFSTMPQEDNLAYVSYAVRRLAAYRNIWWALSNEYEFLFDKTFEDWDAYGELISANDPYQHLLSAHNWITPYPKRDWLTHVSYQGSNPCDAFHYRNEFELPLIVDEIGYEGDIEFSWGNISGFEFMDRVWTATAFGCYGSHGETFHRDDEVLWWAKGGELYGEAPIRMAFLHEILASLPDMLEPACTVAVHDPNGNSTSPGHKALIEKIWAMNSDKAKQQIINEMTQPIGRNEDCKLVYFGRACPCMYSLQLPENGNYKVEIIDMWDMTRKLGAQHVKGKVKIGLPAKEGIALLVTRLEGEVL